MHLSLGSTPVPRAPTEPNGPRESLARMLIMHRQFNNLQWLGSRQNEDTLWRQHCVLRCCLPMAKRGNIVARHADTTNVSEDFQKRFMCPGHKICFGHKCYARGKTSQHLGNVITSAMLPPQCVLVLSGP